MNFNKQRRFLPTVGMTTHSSVEEGEAERAAEIMSFDTNISALSASPYLPGADGHFERSEKSQQKYHNCISAYYEP